MHTKAYTHNYSISFYFCGGAIYFFSGKSKAQDITSPGKSFVNLFLLSLMKCTQDSIMFKYKVYLCIVVL